MSAINASQCALQRNDRLARSGSMSIAPLADRRAYHIDLIALAALPSYECKSRCATFIYKHFKTFEDLQDQAVDAVLDLCEDEDEKTRLVGIKALRATANADRRWVKGNTGVLLQLLESPPAEVAEVHSSLRALMEISPVDVINVMADNCKGSETETGTSRRNVLEFLSHHASDQRKMLLESGENMEAEIAFKSAFGSVLEVLSAGSEDRKVVLGLLESLATNPRHKSDEKAEPSGTRKERLSLAPASEPDYTPRPIPPVPKSLAHAITHPINRPRAEDLSEPRSQQSARSTLPVSHRGKAVTRITQQPSASSSAMKSTSSFQVGKALVMDHHPPNIASPNPLGTSQTASLLERLGKRPRNDFDGLDQTPDTAQTNKSSLLARMSSFEDSAIGKKPRTLPLLHTSVGTPSLRDRMSRVDPSAPRVDHHDRSRRRTGEIQSETNQNHLMGPVGSTPATKLQSQAITSISIKNHSSQSTSPAVGISIRSTASRAGVEDAGVVRKGRGFQKSQNQDELLVMPRASEMRTPRLGADVTISYNIAHDKSTERSKKSTRS